MTTDLRPPGRPRDPALTVRFLEVGELLLADQGVLRLNVDGLCAELHAGKAGFYRRWPDVDHFLADIVRRVAAEPVAYPGVRTVRGDLAMLVLHLVAGDHGRVSCALLSRLPHSDVLLDAWVGVDGPGGRLLLEVEAITAHHRVWAPWLLFLQRGVQRIVAGQREQLLVAGTPDDVQIVLGEIDDLLAAVDRRAARTAASTR